MADSVRRGATDDQLGPSPRPEPMRPSHVVARIEDLLAAMYAVGEDAELAYRAALEELRAVADEAVIALARLESDCHRRSYPRRWALIYAAAELHHEAALPFLRQAVLTPVPPERSANPHSFSTGKEETVLRTTAVEGVGALAARGSDRARESLFEFLAIESISVQRASIQGLLAVDPGLRDEIADRLPRHARYLLDVRPVSVTDVPQIEDPRRHLRDTPRDKPSPPDPAESERRSGEPGPRTGG